jgi:excisionase family DNA binding protein
MPERILTLGEVARMLQISPGYARRLARDGKIPAFRIACKGTWRVREQDLQNWIAQRAGD